MLFTMERQHLVPGKSEKSWTLIYWIEFISLDFRVRWLKKHSTGCLDVHANSTDDLTM